MFLSEDVTYKPESTLLFPRGSSDIYTARFLEGAQAARRTGPSARLVQDGGQAAGIVPATCPGLWGGGQPCPALSLSLVPQPGVRGTADPLLVSWWMAEENHPHCAAKRNLCGARRSPCTAMASSQHISASTGLCDRMEQGGDDPGTGWGCCGPPCTAA